MEMIKQQTPAESCDPGCHPSRPLDAGQRRYYPESGIGGFTDTDGTILFYNRVSSLLRSDSVVVDYGCGRAAFLSDPVRVRRDLRSLRDKVSQVIGLDIDPGARSNPALSEFRQLNSPRWPLEDASADLVVCDSVLEHLPEPAVLFEEAARVLRPGAYLCLRTTNRWHYVGVVSRLMPRRLHGGLLRVAQPSREEQDVFRAFYRCNSVSAVQRQLVLNGFEALVYTHEPEPAYLAFSRWAYALGVLYQRFAPRRFRCTILAFGKRK